MRGIIVDDDSTIQLLLKEYCSLSPELEILEIFDNGIDALKYIQNNKLDFIFLDIHLPSINGMDLAKSLKNPPHIIIITFDVDHALEAFQHATIIDYLIKPLSYSRFLVTLEKLKSLEKAEEFISQPQEKDSIFVSGNGKINKILFENITYIQANSDYIDIYANNKRYVAHSTFKNLKLKLPETLFCQVHRSYIVNMNKFFQIEGNCIIIDKKVIPISKSYKDEFFKKINLL